MNKQCVKCRTSELFRLRVKYCTLATGPQKRQRHTMAQRRRCVRHSRFAIVHWLIVVMYCPPFKSDSVWIMGLCQFLNNSACRGSVRVKGMG